MAVGLRRALVVGAFRLGWAAVRVLPLPVIRPLFLVGADALWWRRGRGVQTLESNLARVVPAVSPAQLRALSRRALRSYARYWREVFRLPVIAPERIVGDMRVDGEPRLRAALAAGRGVVLALPHMGNWDHAGAWLVATGVPFTTVAERLEPADLFDRFVAFRRSLGMEVLALSGGAPPIRVLAERLRAGRCIALVADRDLSEGGVEVDFFGRTARFPVGPAALALATGAALLPVTLWFAEDGTGWRARVHPPVDPPAGADRRTARAAMTQTLADVFATAIAEHPADWHMLQPVWSVDRRRPAARAGRPAAGAG